MAWYEKVNDVLHDVGELADDGIKRVRSSVAQRQELAKIDALYRQIGQLVYEEFEATGNCDERLRSILNDVRRHKEILQGIHDRGNSNAQNVRCTKVYHHSDRARGVGSTRACPHCGTLCIDTAAYCEVCGNSLL